jgi:hypothetical protein
MAYGDEVDFSGMVGKTLVRIEGGEGDDEIRFYCDNGEIYRMHHWQGCCESVYVESVVGDMADLIGSPILMAEESTSGENPADAKPETIEYQESFTWTFYKLATAKGYVDLRWYGESNGYYGEEVDFELVKQH